MANLGPSLPLDSSGDRTSRRGKVATQTPVPQPARSVPAAVRRNPVEDLIWISESAVVVAAVVVAVVYST